MHINIYVRNITINLIYLCTSKSLNADPFVVIAFKRSLIDLPVKLATHIHDYILTSKSGYEG